MNELPAGPQLLTQMPRVRSFVIKAASRCNLDCTYCYVYHKGDETWRDRPKIMPFVTFTAAMAEIRSYGLAQGLREVNITFHGGEPTLIGSRRFAEFCEAAHEVLSPLSPRLAVQTNGTLISADWAGVFREFDVDVGISIDGPLEIHDAHRIDHRGRGSFRRIEAGISRLIAAGVLPSALCVIPLGQDPLVVHRAIADLGVGAIDYLFPDMNRADHRAAREQHGPTPVAAFLTPLLEQWESAGDSAPVAIFMQIAKLVMGGRSDRDTFGGGPQPYMFIEADGALEGLDVLRICENGAATTPLRIQNEGIDAYIRGPWLPSMALRGEIPRPTACRACPEYGTCGGGYLPHRYDATASADRVQAFDNPSIWCEDIKLLFREIRRRLAVDPHETNLRRHALAKVALEGGFVR